MPDARITEVCDGVAAFLADLIAPAAPPETVYATSEELHTADGKTVRVFPASYGDAERLARRRVVSEYRVMVVVEIPYPDAAQPDPAGAVPPAWVREQTAWVDANVYGPLNTAHTHESGGRLLDALTCWTCAVTVVYDPVRLAEDKLYVSVVEAAYREGSEG